MNRTRSVLVLFAVAGSSPGYAHYGHGVVTEAPEIEVNKKASSRGRQWLAGDHHIHSEFSASYQPNSEAPNEPPKPLLGKDGRYTIARNAQMGSDFGLDWMVSTDHGGPLHSRLNFEEAYPQLLVARKTVPKVLIFYGMEFDTPAGDHSSMIIPFTQEERAQLRDIESRYSKREAFPTDPARDTEPKMIEALRFMQALPNQPVLIANHPSRSAKDLVSDRKLS